MSNSPSRFLSLDVFRGMTVCFMIIVNTPGSGATPFAPLLHASWHGFTATDLVFPSFLFAIGNAMSFTKGKYENDSRVFLKILNEPHGSSCLVTCFTGSLSLRLMKREN